MWSVKGTVQAGKTIKIHGLLDGEDFDLTTEPGIRPNTPMREIIIKDKVWICSDGETWHAGQRNDRLIYNWAHVPIMAGGMVEIVSGLKEGERYAVKGAFILKSEVKKGEVVDEHGHGK